MRKGKILRVIKNELEKSDRLNNPLLEIQLSPLYEGGKTRLAFCILEDNNRDDLENLITAATQEHFNVEYVFHNNIDEAIVNFDGDDSVIIENNWRGRLFHREHIINRNTDEAKAFLLKSYWRIIVTRNTGNYFVRTDIFPFFWSHGHSTGNSENYIETVSKNLQNLKDNKGYRVDPIYDVIKVFAKKDQIGTFTPMNYSPLGEATNIISEVDLGELNINYDEKATNALAHLDNYFST